MTARKPDAPEPLVRQPQETGELALRHSSHLSLAHNALVLLVIAPYPVFKLAIMLW